MPQSLSAFIGVHRRFQCLERADWVRGIWRAGRQGTGMARPVDASSVPKPPRADRLPRFAALHSRNFTLLWAGLIVSNAGTQMQSVAQNWMVLKLSGSPTYLGYLGAAFGVPMVLLPMVGGAAADRWDRIVILKITQTAMMLIALAVTLLTWAGVVRPWHFIALTALNASFLAF